jgi:predicted MPP superfamily phosphohydrolase
MSYMRRAVDYTLLRHIAERLLIRISGNGWMATLADRLGWQQRVTIDACDLTVGQPNLRRPPLRIAFASDFHAGPTTHPRFLLDAVQVLADAQPDVLLLGGDFVSLEAKYIEPLAQALGQVPAPYGRFAVLGNHDLWADDYPIRHCLSRAGIEVLVNRHAQLPPPFDHIWICGLDDPTAGAPNAEPTFRGADGVRVVLMHSPEGLAFLDQERFDIALCGHNHGGQIALPNGRALVLPHGKLNRRYVAGHFQVGPASQSRLIVSRGIGYGGLPSRLFARPDVVLCTLRS